MFTTTRRRIAAIAVAVAATFAAAPGPADAYTTSGSGYTGSVGVPVTDAAGSTYSPALVVNGRSIGKVAAYSGYNQYVTIATNLWVLVQTPNSRGYPYWAKVDGSVQTGWISGGQTSIWDGGTAFGSNRIVTYRGYSVTVSVTWQLSNGTVIGRRTIDYEHQGDYRVLNGLWRSGTTNWGGGAYLMYTA